jgi:hypothetical protein
MLWFYSQKKFLGVYNLKSYNKNNPSLVNLWLLITSAKRLKQDDPRVVKS